MHDWLNDIVAQATGLAPEALNLSLRKPLGYQANRLYDVSANGRHLILKEFLVPEEQQEAPGREYKALSLLAPLDIAPRPVYYDPAMGPAVVYEFMEGEMWDRRHPNAADLAQLAHTWLQINDVVSDQLWLSRGYEQSLAQICARLQAHLKAYAEWVDAEFATGRQAAALCLDVLESRRDVVRDLADLEPPLCFCRADPRFANVIRRPGGSLGLIDWEDSGLRDPARDLADIMTHPNQEDLVAPDEWQAFLQPYVAGRSLLDEQLAYRTHLYLVLFPIFWLTVIMNQGRDLASSGRLGSWMVNGLPANLRLRRYLARALAWPQSDFESELRGLADVDFFPNHSMERHSAFQLRDSRTTR